MAGKPDMAHLMTASGSLVHRNIFVEISSKLTAWSMCHLQLLHILIKSI